MASLAHADSAKYLADDASRCEIFRSLSDVIPGECAEGGFEVARGEVGKHGKTRGIVLPSDVESQPTSVMQKDPPKDLAIAMRVEFAFDSFDLTPETKQVLDRVATVLGDDLMKDNRFLIEGHADASGSDGYNLELSKQRARVVTEYLVTAHNIDAMRLAYTGKGEAELFDTNDPNSGLNRRAEFRNLGN
jgi:outer membrane protein OmpA-like peptidoglycan-associated protein